MDSLAVRLAVLGGLVVLAVVVARVLARGAGRAREVRADGPRLTSAELGRPLGAGVTLVQFSSAACAPCRAAARVFAGLAAADDAVEHVELDAAERLDLVRAHGVLRTPTTLVLDAGGRVTRRISGAPTAAQARDAVTDLVAH